MVRGFPSYTNIDNNVIQLTISTVFLNKTAKAAVKTTKRRRISSEKKQDVKRNTTNIIIILKAINIKL